MTQEAPALDISDMPGSQQASSGAGEILGSTSTDGVEMVSIEGKDGVQMTAGRARVLRTVTETASGVVIVGGLSPGTGTDSNEWTSRNDTERLLGIQERLLDAVHSARWHDAIVLHE